MTTPLFGEPPREGRRSLLPLLPLRDLVIFPHVVTPLFVGRPRSIAALHEAVTKDKLIMLAAQTDPNLNDPEEGDIHRVGVVGKVMQLLRLPDATVKALVEGRSRARIRDYLPQADFFVVYAEEIPEPPDRTVETEALMRNVQRQFENLTKINRRISKETAAAIAAIEQPGRLADAIAPHLSLKLRQKQELLETYSPAERLEKIFDLTGGEIEIAQAERKIRSRVRQQVATSQKEAFLNEQMRAIQKELGERDEFKAELKELEDRIRSKKMSEEAVEKVKAEFKKLRMMSPLSAEAAVVRNYIDAVVSLPWFERTETDVDIDRAAQILEEDHFGLEKVKERILEYLAVQKLVRKMKGPILCLVGPPGVGKTSIGKSIARAAGRKFVRISLGGVRDEAEIRGHRRTYIGSMPGKIMAMMKRAGAGNPVFMLDEVDKMSADYRGDPTSALLELLDPEQNHAFNDHYLDMDYDMSDVLFVATANTTQAIPPALQDRMEIIRLPGYTEDEKLAIAKGFLVPKQKEANGLADKDVTFTDGAILLIVRRYTREAGVRNLERELASICRKIARRVASPEHADEKVRVTEKSVPVHLGVARFREQQREEKNLIGIANGLAWTDVGGELLAAEVVAMPGKGKLTVTGRLGEVMQESAKAALSYVRRRSRVLGLPDDFYQKIDLHVHLPEGAIPKDGPSAGIAMATAIASALLRVPARCDVAMTGEITLRGRVLPIGGLKEKLIAARRAGIRKVLIPKDNEKDLHEVPANVRKELEVVLVENMDEVLRHTLAVDDPEQIFIVPGADDLSPALDEPADDRTARLL
jgi:ATP-dependent Lon protease